MSTTAFIPNQSAFDETIGGAPFPPTPAYSLWAQMDRSASNVNRNDQHDQIVAYVQELHENQLIIQEVLDSFLEFLKKVDDHFLNPSFRYCIQEQNLLPTESETLELFFINENTIVAIFEFYANGFNVYQTIQPGIGKHLSFEYGQQFKSKTFLELIRSF